MLRLLSSPRPLCDGLPRRDLLQVGGLGTLGLSPSALLQFKRAAADSSAGHFGKARHCIFLCLYGPPSPLEIVGMKPEAPVETRGTMKPIPSALAGDHRSPAGDRPAHQLSERTGRPILVVPGQQPRGDGNAGVRALCH